MGCCGSTAAADGSTTRRDALSRSNSLTDINSVGTQHSDTFSNSDTFHCIQPDHHLQANATEPAPVNSSSDLNPLGGSRHHQRVPTAPPPSTNKQQQRQTESPAGSWTSTGGISTTRSPRRPIQRPRPQGYNTPRVVASAPTPATAISPTHHHDLATPVTDGLDRSFTSEGSHPAQRPPMPSFNTSTATAGDHSPSDIGSVTTVGSSVCSGMRSIYALARQADERSVQEGSFTTEGGSFAFSTSDADDLLGPQYVLRAHNRQQNSTTERRHSASTHARDNNRNLPEFDIPGM